MHAGRGFLTEELILKKNCTFIYNFIIMETQNIFILEPSTSEEANALKAFATALKIKFEIKEKSYNSEFVAKIQESQKQIQEGKVTRVKKENLKEFLGI